MTQSRQARRVGEFPFTQVHAVAGEHARIAGLGALCVLGEQAALAHTGLAGHEQDRRLSAGSALECCIAEPPHIGSAARDDMLVG